jgi:xanthine dehydrogenase accessory factor
MEESKRQFESSLGLGDITGKIYQEILRLRSEGGTAALATVVRATGSTPGKTLFKMLVYPNRQTLGTVGGGTFEAKVISEALNVIKNQEPMLFNFMFHGSNGVTTDDHPICGGAMEVFIEPVIVGPTLFIMGAGHLGQALAKIGKTTGFRVIVTDDREEFANSQKLPDADEIHISDFDKVAHEIKVDESSHIVIVTRGHQYDKQVLGAFIRSKVAYIGMIGSKKKVKEVFKDLMNEGIEKELLDQVYAPIGLDIGAQTPSEIAVSIMAEIIAHRYGKLENRLEVIKQLRMAQSSCGANRNVDFVRSNDQKKKIGRF